MAHGKERTLTLRSTERPPRGLLKTKGKEHQQQLLFDFYEREDTVSTPRPLVITLFGGGFVLGSRVHEDVRAWCNRFAEEGYLAAAIDYRVMPDYRTRQVFIEKSDSYRFYGGAGCECCGALLQGQCRQVSH